MYVFDSVCVSVMIVVVADAAIAGSEVRHVERMLVRAGAADVSARTPTDGSIPEARLHILHTVVAQIQSLGTTVSRLPQFPRRFTESVLAGARAVNRGGSS